MGLQGERVDELFRRPIYQIRKGERERKKERKRERERKEREERFVSLYMCLFAYVMERVGK
jgi:hypothetical protein